MYAYLLKDEPNELYRMTFDEQGFHIQVRTALLKYIEGQQLRDEVRESISSLGLQTDGEETTLTTPLPFITFPNHAHKKISWTPINDAVNKLSFFLHLLSTTLNTNLDSSCYLSQSPQLVYLWAHNKTPGEHFGCGVGAGFSPRARVLLGNAFPKGGQLQKSRMHAFRCYFGLTISSESEYRKLQKECNGDARGNFFSSITARVREHGIPHFIVPGNCACLGANPDEFRYDPEIYPHNIDSALQVLSMLAALTSLHNDTLTPLYGAS